MVGELEAAAAQHAASLDVPINDVDAEAGTLADTLGEEDPGFELVEPTAAIAAAARELSERQRQVLGFRFFNGGTQTQIAQQVGVSQMQVSRVLRAALRKLNELIDEDTRR